MMEALAVRSLRDLSQADVAQVGGKAASLGEISRAGCTVPPGFVVPRGYRERWSSGASSPELEADVCEACDSVGAEWYAVRSSGIVEDGATASWAGQFDTYLGTRPGDVVARIYDCWRSPGSAHATAYAEQHGALETRWSMAVVVQAMIASEMSGVLFTVDPVMPSSDVCSLEVVAGLGEVLVQGQVTPESYVIRRASGEVVERHRHRQRRALTLTAVGVKEIELPADYRLPLTGATIRELVEIGLRLEDHFGSPQDVEWAYWRGSIYVVQSRPITTL